MNLSKVITTQGSPVGRRRKTQYPPVVPQYIAKAILFPSPFLHRSNFLTNIEGKEKRACGNLSKLKQKGCEIFFKEIEG